MTQARVPLAIMDEMEKQLRQILSPLQSYSKKRGQVIAKAFGRNEIDRVPARIAYILDCKRPRVPCAKNLVMVETFTTMRMVGEMLRARRAAKLLFDLIDDLLLVAHTFSFLPDHFF
jgi:hypothetical protein